MKNFHLSASGPDPKPLRQFQEKCAAVFRPELRENRQLAQFSDFMKRRTALKLGPGWDNTVKNGISS